jgi:hypothetical protein
MDMNCELGRDVKNPLWIISEVIIIRIYSVKAEEAIEGYNETRAW